MYCCRTVRNGSNVGSAGFGADVGGIVGPHAQTTVRNAAPAIARRCINIVDANDVPLARLLRACVTVRDHPFDEGTWREPHEFLTREPRAAIGGSCTMGAHRPDARRRSASGAGLVRGVPHRWRYGR